MNCPHCGKEIEQINLFGHPMNIVANAAVPQGTIVFSNIEATGANLFPAGSVSHLNNAGCAVPNIGTFIKF